jgi:hypothetical protein
MFDSGLGIDYANPVERAHPLNVGRVAWWLCLPGFMGGAKFRDLMSNPSYEVGNHGTLTNMVQGGASGWRGTNRPGGMGVLAFDGTDDYVRIPSSASIKPTTAISLCGWFLVSAFVNSQKILALDYRANGTWSPPYVAYSLNTDEGGNRKASFPIVISGSLREISGSTTLTIGTWYHVAGVYDGVTMKVYVNGRLDGTLSQTGTIDYGTSLDLTIGRDSAYQAGATESMNGSLDDLSIWNRPLSPTEVASLYNLSLRAYPGVLRRIGTTTFFGVKAASGGLLLARRRKLVA